jgi:hypothetical protein
MANESDRDNASFIAILHGTLKNELKVLKTDLVYIHAKFCFLPQFIRKLRDTQHSKSMAQKLCSKKKSHSQLSKNKGFKLT